MSEPTGSAGVSPAAPAARPLEGIRVLDFTTNVSGPFATLALADLGADVVKIERPDRGDDCRAYAPTVNGFSTAFEAINRGKRSIAVDLSNPEGYGLALDLCRAADVVVENMRPGKMERLGLGFDAVSRANSRIVYASLSGFGQTGPLRDRPGYDMVIQARTGIMHLTGETDGSPVRVGTSIVDIGAGIWMALSIVTALFHRARAGGPQHLDVSLYDVGAAWVTLPLVGFTLAGEVPRRMGGQTPLAAPADIYPTADGYLSLAILNDDIWFRFCEVAGLARLAADKRFMSNPLRSKNREQLTEELSGIFAARRAVDWAEILQGAGITCEPVGPPEGLLMDPQAEARGTLLRIEHPDLGSVIGGVALPLGMAEWRDPSSGSAPHLGEHTDQVLEEYGIAAERVERLRAGGVLR